MQRSFLVLALSAFVLSPPAWPAEPPPPSIREVVSRFTQPDWQVIQRAERELESRQKEAIPELIALLDRHEIVDLTNNGGLVYPGAPFYGHGYFVPYDLDYLPARAGWALEELTFENFGFQGSARKKPVSGQVWPVPEGGVRKPEPPTRQERDEKFDLPSPAPGSGGAKTASAGRASRPSRTRSGAPTPTASTAPCPGSARVPPGAMG